MGRMLTSSSAEESDLYSAAIGPAISFTVVPPVRLPFHFSRQNTLYAENGAAEGGNSAAFFSCESLSFAVLESFTACCSGVNGFLVRFFGAGFFFAAAVFFFALTCLVAGSFRVVDLASRFTARLTGLDGSPTVFRGRPGVA